jgi:Fe-S-cluster containining protein
MPKPWTCSRCGDCCRKPSSVTVTVEEAAELVVVHPRVYGGFLTPTKDPRFVTMAAGPCSFLSYATNGAAQCRAYRVRPYNCRRFMCGRDHCLQPFDGAAVPARVLADRGLRRVYERQQREAQPWARAHGWEVED